MDDMRGYDTMLHLPRLALSTKRRGSRRMSTHRHCVQEGPLDGIPACTPTPGPAHCGVAGLADIRRWEQPLRIELLEEIHRGVVSLLLNFLELTKLQGTVLRTTVGWSYRIKV